MKFLKWAVAAAALLITPTLAMAQNMVGANMRASSAFVVSGLVMGMVGIGLGPTVVGILSDRLASHAFASYLSSCPGGKAAKTASDAAKAACSGALVLGTRHGVIVAYAFGLWGAFHYLLGSFGIGKAMAKARAERGEAD